MGLFVALCLAVSGNVQFQNADTARENEQSSNGHESRIASLTAMIAEAMQAGDGPETLSELYALRGMHQVLSGKPAEEALPDLDAALQLNPENPHALHWRAECHERLGNSWLAENDRRLAALLTPRPSPVQAAEPDQISVPPIGAWGGLVALLLVMTSINVSVGNAARKEAGGAFRRLLGVSVVMAILEALPAGILAVHFSRGPVPVNWFLIAMGLTVFNMVCVCKFLQPPVYLTNTTAKFPRVTDERLLARIAELAARMQVPVPFVRLWPSVGSLHALAFVGTIQAPQLIVTDGIVQRLEKDECDAIVGHELAHVANGSLWLLCAVVPLGCAAAMLVLPVMPASMALAFGLAFLVGLRRMISRPVELDCDRRAAQAIGFRATYHALAKIHAVHFIGNSGWLPLLTYGLATHPSRDTRLAALYDAAPENDRPPSPPDRIMPEREYVVAMIAAILWIVVLGGAVGLALRGKTSPWITGGLSIVAMLPIGLLYLAGRRGWTLNRKRNGQRSPLVKLLAVVGIGGLLILLLQVLSGHLNTHPRDPGAFPLEAVATLAALLSILFGLLYWLARTSRRRKLEAEVLTALQLHDFHGVLTRCEAHPRVVKKSYKLRHNEALARSICGDRDSAIEAMEQLWIDKPNFPLTAIALCGLHLEAGRPERALDLAREVAMRLPDDPLPPLLEAHALRNLGRLDAADEACQRSLALEPQNGPTLAIRAAVALDRGDREQARDMLDRAEALSPGDTYVRVVEAEFAIRHGTDAEARAALDGAQVSVRGNPFASLDWELRRLEAMLTERLSPVATENIFLE